MQPIDRAAEQQIATPKSVIDARADQSLANQEGDADPNDGAPPASPSMESDGDEDSGGESSNEDRPLSRREVALQRIAERQTADRSAAELAAQERKGEHFAPVPTSDPNAPAPQPTIPKVAPPDDLPLKAGEDGTLNVVLKINGQEVIKPLRDVINESQKGIAADAKLMKASIALRSAMEVNEELARRAEAMRAAPPQNQSGSPSSQDASLFKTSGKAFVEALYTEDTEGALQHLETIVAGRSNPTQAKETQTPAPAAQQDPVMARINQTRQELAEVDHAERLQDWQQSKERFMKEFPEIKPGTTAWKAVDAISKALAEPSSGFSGSSYYDYFREAGSRFRNSVREVAPISARTQAKFENPHVGSRSSVTQSRPPQQQAPAKKNMSQLIAELKVQRRPQTA